MAIYKIFPEKDATLYSDYPTSNTGRDEILEIGNIENTLVDNLGVRRAIIKFPTTIIESVINNLFDVNSRVSQSFSASLKLYLAEATSIPLDYSIECYPISSSWNMGVGKFLDNPINTDGVSWKFVNNSSSGDMWSTSSFSQDVTASFTSTSGGGTWYFTSSVFNNVKTTQYFSYNTTKAINISRKALFISAGHASLIEITLSLKSLYSTYFATATEIR